MSATEELRAMLDERGVEWMDDSYAQLWCTVWHGQDGKQWRMTENQSGMLTELKAWNATPAQAIEATLGRGKCEADETDLIPFSRADSGDFDVDYIHVMECSACGGTYEHVNGSYEFCPRCGRKLVTA